MWIDRFKIWAVCLGVALVLVVGASGGALGTVVGWLLCVYVLVRAVPGIRDDWRRVRSHLVPERKWAIQ